MSSPGVLLGQGANPSCHQGQALRTGAPKGTAERLRMQESERLCFGLASTMRQLRRDWTSETLSSAQWERGQWHSTPQTPPPLGSFWGKENVCPLALRPEASPRPRDARLLCSAYFPAVQNSLVHRSLIQKVTQASIFNIYLLVHTQYDRLLVDPIRLFAHSFIHPFLQQTRRLPEGFDQKYLFAWTSLMSE